MVMWLVIALGGAIGALSRYSISQFVVMVSGASSAPLATIIVNMIGSGMMGVMYGYLSAGGMMAETLRLFIMVGFLGALTTFSTFSMDIMIWIDRGQIIPAIIYTMVSVVGSVLIFMVAAQIIRAKSGAG